MIKNIIYFHICCINTWREIYKKLLFCIYASDLYYSIDEIRCVILGVNYDDIEFNDPKIKIIFKSPNINLHEHKIMELIYENCLNEDINILYIHTKGIKHNCSPVVIDWINYLIYFNMSQ